jgi:predicted DNA-binding transcriptional regulator AlpA
MEILQTIEEVETAVSFSKSKIYTLIKAGVKLGRRTRRWAASQVQEWITQQIGAAK